MANFPVHTVETAPEASRPLLQGLQSGLGMVPNLAAAMAESPELLQGFLQIRELFYGASFTPGEVQVVALTNAFENGCSYCMALHSSLARKEGVPQEEIAALRGGRPPADPRLAALSDFSRRLVRDRGVPRRGLHAPAGAGGRAGRRGLDPPQLRASPDGVPGRRGVSPDTVGGARGMRAAPSPVGELLRDWRKERRMSQLALALEAGVSPRHVSFVETGRSQPSREMLHHLAETLDVPLRERNALLTAAGFAPTFREADADLAAPELAPVRAALEAILRQQEPFPAVVMDRRWDVVRTNDAAARFFAYLLGGTDTRDAPDRGRPNVLRMMFDPRALRPRVANWESVAQTLLGRARREAVGGVIDAALRGVLDEVLACPGVPRSWASLAAQVPQIPVVPVTFERDGRTFRYFSTVTTLGTPQDVSLQELRVECFFPLDEATRAEAARLADRGSAGC